MKVKKQKNKSPVYRYKHKDNLKLPELLEKKKELEEKIAVMKGKGWGVDRSTRALKRVNEDIEDIQGRTKLSISNHFRNRWHDRVSVGDSDEQIMEKLHEARIDNAARVLGSGVYPLDPYVVIINEGILVTILDPSVPKEHQ